VEQLQSPRPIQAHRVALYIRWSTDDQAEGTTLEVQVDACRQYAGGRGWTVRDELVFVDDGYSGGSLERPALRRLREAVGRGEVDCVLVYKLDRLSRDVPDMIRLILDEWEGRCCVQSAREPIDTTTQSGRMFFYTLASYAEWERSVIRERTFSGKLRRAREGKNPGMRAPYGYALQETGFALVPHEAAVVRRIFAVYRSGSGAAGIAAALNREGIPFRGGRLWNASTVKHILGNAAYRGDLVYGRRLSDPRRGSRVRSAQPHLTTEGVFPVVVSREEWNLVQEVRRSRPGPAARTSGRSLSSGHLLTGLLRCGNCGRHMRAAGALYRDRRYSYYTCSAVGSMGSAACGARRIRQTALNSIVVARLKRLYGCQVRRQPFVEQLEAESAAREAQARGAVTETEAALARVAAKRRRLRSLLLEGSLSADDYRACAGDLRQEEAALEERRAGLQQALTGLSLVRTRHAGLAEALARVDVWESLQPAEQKALLRSFVRQVSACLSGTDQTVDATVEWRILPKPAGEAPLPL
jgi:site-specific DNA recombinase